MLADIRQLLYPKEFRIGPPAWPTDLRATLEDILARLQSASSTDEPGDARDDKELDRLLADVSTGIWRARRRLVLPEGQELSADVRLAHRHVESTWDALMQGGVEIKDHTGDVIMGGEALRIIAFQPCPGLRREQVIETVKPTVFRADRIIQRGEVIVGKPVPEGAPVGQTPD